MFGSEIILCDEERIQKRNSRFSNKTVCGRIYKPKAVDSVINFVAQSMIPSIYGLTF